jgi:type IV pilus assembly protein PilC
MPLFENSDAELPAATKALVATSNFLQSYYLILIFLISSFLVFIVGYKATES